MHIGRRIVILAMLAIASLAMARASWAQAQEDAQEIDASWPRQLDSDLGHIIIYQPQMDTLDGITLTGRAAVSLQAADAKEPVFGAIWFRSQLSVDRDAGLVTFESTKILRSKFPDSTPEDLQKFSDTVEAEIPKWDLVVTLDQLETSLASTEKERASTENLKSDPPIILFSQTPAVLVNFDGDPETRAIENSPYERVVNTAFLIIKDKNSGSFYLSNGQTWYTARNARGPWSVTDKTPADVQAMVKPDADAEKDSGPPPRVITATEPTELVVTEGAPKWAALTGNDLLYVSNTETTMVKEIATNKYYVLLSGRWFSSQALDGPWSYERSDQLPASFKKIAPASPIGDALTAVAGTNQAEDADMDAEIPQTAAIKRSEAKVEVSYDGAAQFQPIPSTDIQYAVNTDSSVLKIGDRYYVCDNAVWFAGLTPNGPWTVADSVPDSVKSIPPSSPVYNVRYVTIYDSTPDIVYVGYTPGYIGTYRYYGTVVYGTGWRYRPWIGPRYYYPRPFTWGFHVIYNPWSGGWGFALGYSTSFINVSIGWGRSYYHRPPYWGGGWWGPGGYRPIYRPLPGYRPPYRPPNNVIIIQPIRPGRPGQPGYRPRPPRRDNIYARPGISDTVKKDYRPKGRTPRPATGKPNNVYTDKDGNVYRRGKDGKWEKRENGNWTKPAPGKPSAQPTKPGTRPAPNPSEPGTKPGTRPGTKPGTKPGAPPKEPSIQPVPENPPAKPGKPSTRPSKPGTTPGTKPGAPPKEPSIQPVPENPPAKPGNPSTRPTPRPSKPDTTPGTPPKQPSIQPVPNNPPAKPANPSARPAPRPSNPSAPSAQPVPANPQPKPTRPATRPQPKPEEPSAQPSIQPAPSELDRDARARDRASSKPTRAPQNNSPRRTPTSGSQSAPNRSQQGASSNARPVRESSGAPTQRSQTQSQSRSRKSQSDDQRPK
jgi:hypothetical protein